MFTLLIERAAELLHTMPGSPEAEEFEVLTSAIDAYEAKRGPAGLQKKSSAG